jgi:hypothetical protein
MTRDEAFALADYIREDIKRTPGLSAVVSVPLDTPIEEIPTVRIAPHTGGESTEWCARLLITQPGNLPAYIHSRSEWEALKAEPLHQPPII